MQEVLEMQEVQEVQACISYTSCTSSTSCRNKKIGRKFRAGAPGNVQLFPAIFQRSLPRRRMPPLGTRKKQAKVLGKRTTKKPNNEAPEKGKMKAVIMEEKRKKDKKKKMANMRKQKQREKQRQAEE